MGGRGSTSKFDKIPTGASLDGTIIGGEKRHYETSYIEAHGWQKANYKSEVLEAKTDGKGNLTFGYASPTSDEKTAKTNKTHYVSYDIQAGGIDGDIFGINFDAVASISGQTYNIKEAIKQHGFKWDSANKRWVNPNYRPKASK